MPLLRADPAQEIVELVLIEDELPVQMTRIPVDQHAAEVEYDSRDLRVGHCPTVTPACTGTALPGDAHLHDRVPRRAVRLGRGLDRRLGVPGLVGRPRLDDVAACGGVPEHDPLPPGVDAGHSRQPGLPPGTAVYPNLDRIDALVLRPGDSGDRGAPRLDRALPVRYVDPRLGLDRSLGEPAALRPVRLVGRVRGDLDIGYPLARRDVPVEPGHHGADREAVRDRQRLA